jgi:multicomponent Na+:H+ antiporter subunit E
VARPVAGHRRLTTIAVLTLVYAALWLVLSNNQGWGFGVVVIALAVLCGLSARIRVRPVAWRFLPGFLVFFLSRMLMGGLDVARRTLRRDPDIEPGWVKHQLQDASPSAHMFLSATTGLLPGTLAARLEGHIMRVHTLDTRDDWQRDITHLEIHLARLFPPVANDGPGENAS